MAANFPPVPKAFALLSRAQILITEYAPGSRQGLRAWINTLAIRLATRGVLVAYLEYWYRAALLGLPVARRTECYWPEPPGSDSD